MDIITMIMIAVVSVLTMLITTLRIIPWRTLVHYHWFADIAFTVTLMVLFSGSMTGMIIAVISGLVFSVTLSFAKLFTPPLN